MSNKDVGEALILTGLAGIIGYFMFSSYQLLFFLCLFVGCGIALVREEETKPENAKRK